MPEPPRVPMDLVITRELELLGSHGMAAHAYPEMLSLIEAGRLRPAQLVTSRIPLEEAPRALAAMTDASPVGITVIRP
jgi:alcohol dehydrogenase